MTIGVAALCTIQGIPGWSVVAFSDRKLTLDGMEYEPVQGKRWDFPPRAIALLAGNMDAQFAICETTTATLKARGRLPSVKEVAEAYADAVLGFRRQATDRVVLGKYGLTRDEVLGATTDMSAMFREIQDYQVDAAAIIAGADSTGGHLYAVYEPGEIVNCEARGFIAVGTGERHSHMRLQSVAYTAGQSANEAIFLAYSAKRRAESAPHVGAATDGVFVTQAGIMPIPGELMAELAKHYNRSIYQENKTFRKSLKELEGFYASLAKELAMQQAIGKQSNG